MSVLFKTKESYLHNHAKMLLAGWVGGQVEMPFDISGRRVFVPDVVAPGRGCLDIYEVVNTNPIDGVKLGRIQSWVYHNDFSVSVKEVSASWIMSRTERPEYIEYINRYYISVNDLL